MHNHATMKTQWYYRQMSKYCRLWLNMYLQLKLKIWWNATYLECFTICNGGKWGWSHFTSFILYLYRWISNWDWKKWCCLLHRGVCLLTNAFGYADILKLLAPTIRKMSKMVICEHYILLWLVSPRFLGDTPLRDISDGTP